MERNSTKIDLARLANEPASEVPSMVRELEGADLLELSENLHWPLRFLASGLKHAPRRWPSRFMSVSNKQAPLRK